MSQAETTLIIPRRNFLVRALGFTAAGATMVLPITTLASAKARIDHHQAELEKAWRDYYGPDVRTVHDAVPVGTIEPAGKTTGGDYYPPHYRTSIFLICAGGAAV